MASQITDSVLCYRSIITCSPGSETQGTSIDHPWLSRVRHRARLFASSDWSPAGAMLSLRPRRFCTSPARSASGPELCRLTFAQALHHVPLPQPGAAAFVQRILADGTILQDGHPDQCMSRKGSETWSRDWTCISAGLCVRDTRRTKLSSRRAAGLQPLQCTLASTVSRPVRA